MPPNPHQPPMRPVFGMTPPPSAPVPSAVDAAHTATVELTDATFAKIVEQAPANMPVLVECWADWCATCKLLMPTIHQMAQELRGKAVVATLNSDQNPMLATKLGLRSMPTILVYRGGKLVQTLFGMQTKGKLLAAMGLA